MRVQNFFTELSESGLKVGKECEYKLTKQKWSNIRIDEIKGKLAAVALACVFRRIQTIEQKY